MPVRSALAIALLALSLSALSKTTLAQTGRAAPSTVAPISIGNVTGKNIHTTGFCSPVILVNNGNFTLNCDKEKGDAIQLLNEQISNLYSPLYFELAEGDAEWEQFQTMFQQHFRRRSPLVLTRQVINGTTTIVPVPLAPAEWSVWTQWVDKAFLPRNGRINALLHDDAQYVVGGTLTPCMKEFLAYKQAFDHNREEAMQHAELRTWPVEQNWPVCFTHDTEQTLRSLEARRAKLLAGGK